MGRKGAASGRPGGRPRAWAGSVGAIQPRWRLFFWTLVEQAVKCWVQPHSHTLAGNLCVRSVMGSSQAAPTGRKIMAMLRQRQHDHGVYTVIAVGGVGNGENRKKKPGGCMKIHTFACTHTRKQACTQSSVHAMERTVSLVCDC